MPSRIIAMLVIPLVLQAIFYLAAIFFEMPHWAVAIGQSLYLVAILAIDFFEGRKDKQ